MRVSLSCQIVNDSSLKKEQGAATVEFVALAPILLGESLTSTSLIAAHSSLSILTAIFPGSDEASFSLTSSLLAYFSC